MKLINKFTFFVLSFSQVVFANNKIDSDLSNKTKKPIESEKKTLAQELYDKNLIKTIRSSESANCVGNLTD